MVKKQTTKIQQVIQLIEARIESHEILPGGQLPSLRKLAKSLNFSVSTVLEAYERLVVENKIEVRHGSGYFVKQMPYTNHTIDLSSQYKMQTDPFWIAHQSLIASDDHLKPGCGWLPTSWMPESIVRKSLKELSNKPAKELLTYSTVLGYEPLREVIAQRINYYGTSIHHDQILLTESSTQALDIICRAHLNVGDTILVDDPCYFNFFTLFNLLKLQIIAIPFTPQGPDLNYFKEALKHSPKMYITNSGIHNPTGASLNISTAYKVLKMAEEANVIIIEDDIYSDFEIIPSPRYASLSNFENVIQISSFSKSLSSSFRCGYIAAETHYIKRLTQVKIATNFNCNQLSSVLVHQALKDTQYRRHFEYINQRLSHARAFVIQELKQLEIVPWTIPKNGMFLWCQLPENVSATALTENCRKDHLILAAGTAFSHSKHADQFMRFNVAQSLEPHIFKTLKKHIQI